MDKTVSPPGLLQGHLASKEHRATLKEALAEILKLHQIEPILRTQVRHSM